MLSDLLLHILVVVPPKLKTEEKGQYADSIQEVVGIIIVERLCVTDPVGHWIIPAFDTAVMRGDNNPCMDMLKCEVTSHSEAHCIVYGIVWRTYLFGCVFLKKRWRGETRYSCGVFLSLLKEMLKFLCVNFVFVLNC